MERLVDAARYLLTGSDFARTPTHVIAGSPRGTVVYFEYDERNTCVAIKTAAPNSAAEFRMELADEAAAVRAATGDYSAKYVDAWVGSMGPRPWVATEYVAAPTLAAAIAEMGRPLPPVTVRRLGAAVATALARLHAAGWAHADVNPNTLLLGPSGPVLIDFGDAVRLGPDTPQRPGTKGFVAPEQMRGAAPSPAGDVYALGATLAFAVTGKDLFQEFGLVSGEQIRSGAAPGMMTVPQDARDLIADCLAADPGARRSADEIARQVRIRRTQWWPKEVTRQIDKADRELAQAKIEAREPHRPAGYTRPFYPNGVPDPVAEAAPPSGRRYGGGRPPYQGANLGPAPGEERTRPNLGPLDGGSRRPGKRLVLGGVAVVVVLALGGLALVALNHHSSGNSAAGLGGGGGTLSSSPTPTGPAFDWVTSGTPLLSPAGGGSSAQGSADRLYTPCSSVTVSVTLNNTGSHIWALTGASAVSISFGPPPSTGCSSAGTAGNSVLTAVGATTPGASGVFRGQVTMPSGGDFDATGVVQVGGGAAPSPGPTIALHIAAAPAIGISSVINGSSTVSWIGTSDGDVVSPDGTQALQPASGYERLTGVIGIACPDAGGCWLTNDEGTVVPYGDAEDLKAVVSATATPDDSGIVGIAAADRGGFWLAQSSGATAIPYGDAPGDPSTVNTDNGLNEPVCGITATGDGGYWLVASDGGVFSSASATSHGSMVNDPRNPDEATDFVAIVATPDGGGYFVADQYGDVFNFGDANESTAAATASPDAAGQVVGIAATAGGGYETVDIDGNIYTS